MIRGKEEETDDEGAMQGSLGANPSRPKGRETPESLD